MEIQFNNQLRLGEGGFGKVFQGIYKEREVAVKRVELIDATDNEEEALVQLDHPNIVKLFHVECTADFKFFALELCAASLDQIFLKPDNPRKYNGPKLPNHSVVFFQLADGLEFIHLRKLIHRDIKPENVLISVGSTGPITMKLADFGLSRSVNERGTFTMNSGIKGTKNWFAPELLRVNSPSQESDITGQPRGTVKSDIFALGLVFGYLLLSGQHLYGSEHKISSNIIGKKIININQIKDSHYARQLIGQMLVDEPDDRISSTEAVIELKLIKEKVAKDETELWQMCSNVKTLDLSKIKESILFGIDVNETDYKGWNVLHWLCLNHTDERLTDAINLLSQLEIDIKRKNHDGWNALHILCMNNPCEKIIKAIKLLIELGIDLNESDADGWNALHNLCLNNNSKQLIDALKLLILRGIDVNATTNTGKNALHCLCEYQFSENLIGAMELLIEHGINTNGKTNTGKNALHCLCRFNSSKRLIDAIKLLIQQGIDVTETDSDGNNALHHLCQFYSSERLIDAIKLLIHFRIDVNGKGNSGFNALHYLCICNSSESLIEAIKLLVQHGIDVNSRDNGGYNALHFVCEYSFTQNLIDTIQLLIELGIDIHATTNNGKNALHCLCQFSSSIRLIDAIKLLIKHGIDVESNGFDARCLLRSNYRKNDVEDIIQLLNRAHTAQFFRVLPFVNKKFTKFKLEKTITDIRDLSPIVCLKEI